MGKAIKAAKEIATKYEAAVQELRDKAGDKADELLAEAEKLAASTTMTQTEAVYAIIQKMTEENAQAIGGVSSSEAAEALAQLGKPEAPAPSVTLEDLEGTGLRKKPKARARRGGSPTTAAQTGPAGKSQRKRQSLTGSGNWQRPRSRRSRKSWPLLSAATKTAPVFSPGSSRNTSRRCRTRPQRPKRATGCCLERSPGNSVAAK